jgi:hypothetical protein
MLTTRRSPEYHPLHLTKHPTLQPQYAGREWRPFHVQPRRRTDWSLVLLPDRSLRCQSVKKTRRRGGVNKRHNQHDITAITHITEHFSSRTAQNTSSDTSSNTSISSINDASTRRKSPSEPPETPNITAPVRGKRVVPLSCTPMDGRWTSALRLPLRPQFTVSESEEYTVKRRSCRARDSPPHRTIPADRRTHTSGNHHIESHHYYQHHT